MSKAECLSGTVLKLIAVVSMTIDHIGYIFFPHEIWLRCLGRLAFPIFAYMIAEGCFYTKNKKRYLLLVLGIGVLCQAAMWIAMKSLSLNIMFTLTLSIAFIFLLQWAMGRKQVFSGPRTVQEPGGQVRPLRLIVLAAGLAFCLFADYGLRSFVAGYSLDYGFFGVMLAVVIYIMPKKYLKLIAAGVWMVLLCLDRFPVTHSTVQWWSLLALIPLALYNGQPGRRRMKYFFYLYYPLHLGILWGIYFLK